MTLKEPQSLQCPIQDLPIRPSSTGMQQGGTLAHSKGGWGNLGEGVTCIP